MIENRLQVEDETEKRESPCNPIRRVSLFLGQKWTLEMLYSLGERRRFCELQQMVGGVNPATLSKRLKTLESEGLIQKCACPQSDVFLAYELTEKGKGLKPILDEMVDWANTWGLADEE